MHMSGFFQNAYVTRDLDKAIADLRGRHDVTGQIMEIPFITDVITPHGSGPVTAKVALVRVGDVQFELIRSSTRSSTMTSGRRCARSRNMRWAGPISRRRSWKRAAMAGSPRS